MIDARIPIFIAQDTSEQCCFFPFIQWGITSQLPESKVAILKEKIFPLEAFYIRCAQVNDAPYLYDLLRSYGTSTSNYEDLELFPEAKMDLIVKNVSSCLTHRFFISFLLFYEDKPIAFFQVDPYRLDTITDNFNHKILPIWSQCFAQKLVLSDLVNLSFSDRLQWLQSFFIESAFRSCLCLYRIEPNATSWLNFIAISLETYKRLCRALGQNDWIGNISYNLFPAFQRKGLMSKMISTCGAFLGQNLHCKYLFSDRIADKNKASCCLLQKLNFQTGGHFFAYYGPEYHTRNHPDGHFFEGCICFYKKMI